MVKHEVEKFRESCGKGDFRIWALTENLDMNI